MRSIRIRGAREHNLRGISLDIPRDRLTVLTGVSGSGKSSLAFDTIYKEGRRRFLESLPVYARAFLGGIDKPRVEAIDGLSPAIAIEQKSIGHSPRSTVGTLTEIHDHLRLLYARLGEPRCPSCDRAVVASSPDQIVDRVLARRAGRRVFITAPVVRQRRGELRGELERLRRDGFTRLRIDGVIERLSDELPRLDRRRLHSIEIVLDRLEASPRARARLVEAVEKSSEMAEGLVGVSPAEAAAGEEEEAEIHSVHSTCPHCSIDLPPLEPRLFSFNSPAGACPRCQGLGRTERIDPRDLIADPDIALGRGGLALFDCRGRWLEPRIDRTELLGFLRRRGFRPTSSWGDLDEPTRRALLDGDEAFAGLGSLVESIRAGASTFLSARVRELKCPACSGARLSPLARGVRFAGRTLPELCDLSIRELTDSLEAVRLEGVGAAVAEPILREVLVRLRTFERVGLSYLTLSRATTTLAGGEAQRLRLAAQIGGGLRGVVFVLDEPSIGLHARDHGRLLRSLESLRDRGNTVLVVEHDEETIRSGDAIVDLGPGAGRRGGEIVAEGSLERIATAPESITGAYLSGRRRIEPRRARGPAPKHLELAEVRHHNLAGIDVSVPLGRFVVVTGVSGSGKSSLVRGVLEPALLRKLGRISAPAGRHRSLRGARHVDKVIDIDQSPIGRSPRSNPATYTGVLGPIRDLYSKVPEARARGYGPGRFSFNVSGGRCLDCGGAGVTTIDMQFLAPVEVVCEACGGRRYNRETLEILWRGRSISDVLAMTVSEAAELFRDQPRIVRSLAVLEKVGLGYLELGQPSTTLSGGESQRLKLSAELQKRATGKTLYLLDEPTTGLHFEDVRVLLEVLHELVDRGNSMVVIEHNLDVVRSADWVIDLGPEAGEAGGRVVVAGSLQEVLACEGSRTGEALRRAAAGGGRPEAGGPDAGSRKKSRLGGAGAGTPGGETRQTPETRRTSQTRELAPDGEGDLVVREATIHNLKGVDVRIPRPSLTVITGVSGSGKTSLAHDTLFAEGQRCYTESLSTYARQFLGRLPRPPLREIHGLSPAIAIDQRSVARGHRSTVATSTEIHDHLRLLFARLGTPHCPECGELLRWTTPTALADRVAREHGGERLFVLAPAAPPGESPRGVSRLLSGLLESGFTRVRVGESELRIDEEDAGVVLRRVLAARRALEEEGRTNEAALHVVIDRLVVGDRARTRLADSLEQGFGRGEGRVLLQLEGRAPVVHTRVPACPAGHWSFPGELTPRMFSFNNAEGACPRCGGLGQERRALEGAMFPAPCEPFFQAMDPRLRRFIERYRPSTVHLLKALLDQLGVPAETPFARIGERERAALLGGEGVDAVRLAVGPGRFDSDWDGLSRLVESWARDDPSLLRRSGLERVLAGETCSLCSGARLRPEILAVRIGGRNIHEVSALTIESARQWLASTSWSDREREIGRDLLREIENRLGFLENVGLGYLELDRPAATLSGGEARRIRLASQLGNRLVGVLYVLDEPTVGLHPRDTARLLESLRELRDLGNTVVVVEHDRDTIRAADYLIDMGPGAGEHGGEVVAAGPPREVAAASTLTGRYLRGEETLVDQWRRRPRRAGEGDLVVEGARCHNLRGLRVAFPLRRLTVVTGVSGSGKSSLVLDVLARVLPPAIRGEPLPEGLASGIRGHEALDRLSVVDQRPIGRTPKSTPATYTGLWTPIRELFARLPESRVRGWGPGRFSFNSPAGRCRACDGQGRELIDMHFLSDVWVECEHCHGRRFDEATRQVRFRGHSISDILDLEVRDALDLFENQPKVRRVLEVLFDVGLGYLRLGQSAATLSGGEAQRVKLATELVGSSERTGIYLLDEPTTGLHFDDVRKLLCVLQRLVDAGHTVVVIEHNIEVIAAADHVIELGPEAGPEGGRIVAEGSPEEVVAIGASPTARWLEPVLRAAGKRAGNREGVTSADSAPS